MITNEVQYRATKGHLEQFEHALANLAAKPGNRTKLEQLEFDAVSAKADDFRAEIAEYEQLRSGGQVSFSASSLAELSTVLIKARIARGWTQRQLGEAIGIAEQQIQRYEANDYRSTSLARLCDIADALNVQVQQRGELRTPAA